MGGKDEKMRQNIAVRLCQMENAKWIMVNCVLMGLW
jgi:hypothetical protein